MSPIISEGVVYKRNYCVPDVVAWRYPRSMPVSAARSYAMILSVKPERVQDITEEEATSEGIEYYVAAGGMQHEEMSMRMQFSMLWNSIYPGSWERNDWCWRIELAKESK